MPKSMSQYFKEIKLIAKIDDKSAEAVAEEMARKEKEARDKAWDEWAKGVTKKLDFFYKPMQSGLSKLFKTIKDGIKDTIKSGFEEINNLVSYSTLSNENFRNLAFTYGFTSAQAYGFDKARQLMGFQSEEDIMWAEPWQQEKFAELMGKYADNYNELYDEGFFADYLDFQYEWAEFKQDFLLDVCSFIMDNKDIIKSGMVAIVNILETVTDFADWISLNFGRDTSRVTTSVADYISNTINNNNARSTLVNITNNNNYNNANGQGNFNDLNPGGMNYQQLIEILGK